MDDVTNPITTPPRIHSAEVSFEHGYFVEVLVV